MHPFTGGKNELRRAGQSLFEYAMDYLFFNVRLSVWRAHCKYFGILGAAIIFHRPRDTHKVVFQTWAYKHIKSLPLRWVDRSRCWLQEENLRVLRIRTVDFIQISIFFWQSATSSPGDYFSPLMTSDRLLCTNIFRMIYWLNSRVWNVRDNWPLNQVLLASPSAQMISGRSASWGWGQA